LGEGISLEEIRQVENQGIVSVFVTFKTVCRFCYQRQDLPEGNS